MVKHVELGKTGLQVPDVALGVMRIADKTAAEADAVIQTALDHQINFFDTADIYAGGRSSTTLGDSLARLNVKREDIILQSKGGIIIEKGQINGDGLKGPRYDFSKEHLIAAAEIELKRLRTDYLDVFLLHRPDTLLDPEGVAEAFASLKAAGKVRHFGVSNMNPWQVELVQSAIDEPLVANQLQFGIMHTGMIDSEFHVNMSDERSIDHDGGILAYSRLKKMTIQAWSPFQYGFFEGPFIDNPKFATLNDKLAELADKYGVSKNAIAVAFITYHPAKMQAILGSMNPERLAEMMAADQVSLTNQEWYDIYFAAGNDLP
ncbi:oxidoreductase [Weissella oryzae SG25]|uniref:Oxidoreductase n=1 Tax=Weissella oryzae (strain DSM 25784 / JCM 18191 / LMG 30913 / SG25) TaxID=1329250 RepID=A0A069CT30_WEIOS|nr:aldo/keto reductase [Weissella oryzae]GAK30975.1 oxidoreductase [Weissella oryzae SG25]